MTNDADVRRLETLWAEDLGDEYVDCNSDVHVNREPLWGQLHENHPFTNVLEVGCNMGANLQWLAKIVGAENVWGVDVNAYALRTARSRLPDVNVVRSPARSLPLRDAMSTSRSAPASSSISRPRRCRW
jgi:methylase of polypeptide subunit release factors